MSLYNVKIFLNFWFNKYPKMTKNERKDYHQYIKSNRATKHKLRKIIKNYGPWDYGYLIDMINEVAKNWCDYYKLGYNVQALDSEGQPTRLEIAEHIVSLCNKFYDINCVNEQEKIKELFDYLGKYLIIMWD